MCNLKYIVPVWNKIKYIAQFENQIEEKQSYALSYIYSDIIVSNYIQMKGLDLGWGFFYSPYDFKENLNLDNRIYYRCLTQTSSTEEH